MIMNKAEEKVKEKYKKMGYHFLHNKGFPDFAFYRVKDNRPCDVMFVEVKSKRDKLKHEQMIFRKIVDALKLNYKVEVV